MAENEPISEEADQKGEKYLVNLKAVHSMALFRAEPIFLQTNLFDRARHLSDCPP